jgi:dTMP kinase
MVKYTRRRPGQLIVVDGIDQSGKKTQTRLLVRRIQRQGIHCVSWDFPAYQTPVGRVLKAYLAVRERPYFHAVHLLYAANKWEVAKKVADQMEHGGVLVANRYTPSNLAYGVAHGLSLRWLRMLEVGLPIPTRIFILDVPVKTSFGRKKQSRDVHEEDSAYLQKVRRSYLRLARKYHWRVVNGNADPLSVHEVIWNEVVSILE